MTETTEDSLGSGAENGKTERASGVEASPAFAESAVGTREMLGVYASSVETLESQAQEMLDEGKTAYASISEETKANPEDSGPLTATPRQKLDLIHAKAQQIVAAGEYELALQVWGETLAPNLETLAAESEERTIEGLLAADLDAVRFRNQAEVIRHNAIKVVLDHCDTPDRLRGFEQSFPIRMWQEKEFMQFFNRYRLMSSQEDQIRLYESSPDIVKSIRMKEFYALALIRQERPTEAIQVLEGLISEGQGHESYVLRGALGEAYSSKMRLAEALVGALQETGGTVDTIDQELRQRFEANFGAVSPETAVEEAQSRIVESRDAAIEQYKQGFLESGKSFPILRFTNRMMEKRLEAMSERARLAEEQGGAQLSGEEATELAANAREIETLTRAIENLDTLSGIALENEGGAESLDYWIHAGQLELASHRGAVAIDEWKPIVARVLKEADALFKLDTTIARLEGIHAILSEEARLAGQAETDRVDARNLLIAELKNGRKRFVVSGQEEGSALNEDYQQLLDRPPTTDQERYVRQSFSFQSLLGAYTSQYFSGGVYYGARVPDLIVDTTDRATLMAVSERIGLDTIADPKAINEAIKEYLRERFGIHVLQDLQSQDHKAFDELSDAMLLLSGYEKRDPEDVVSLRTRKGSRTLTNLSALLLTGIADCRETLHTQGALFTIQRNQKVTAKFREAMAHLESGDQGSFDRVTKAEIPAIVRHELRGHVGVVYVESMAVEDFYRPVYSDESRTTPLYAPYDGELTSYERANAMLKVTYANGATRFLSPEEHSTPGGEAATPTIPNQEQATSISVLVPYESHSFATLHDRDTGMAEFADGFYDDLNVESPYDFGSGPYEVHEAGLIEKGVVELADGTGTIHRARSYILPSERSTTKYLESLGETDLTDTFLLNGREFDGQVTELLREIEAGTSRVPELMRKIREWGNAQQ